MNLITRLARPTRLTMLAAALALSATAHADIIENGGFEIGQADGWLLSGNTAFVYFDGFAPHSGNVGASIGAAPQAPATLSQMLNTVAGSSYRISFWLNNEVDGSELEPNAFQLNWDGGAPEVQLSNVAAFDYTQFSYTFAAASALTEISFTFSTYNGYWNFDDVSVSAVPEPSTLALFALGLLGCGVSIRRRL